MLMNQHGTWCDLGDKLNSVNNWFTYTSMTTIILQQAPGQHHIFTIYNYGKLPPFNCKV